MKTVGLFLIVDKLVDNVENGADFTQCIEKAAERSFVIKEKKDFVCLFKAVSCQKP